MEVAQDRHRVKLQAMPESAPAVCCWLMYTAACRAGNGSIAGDAGSFPGPDWQPKQAHMADLQAVTAAKNLVRKLNGGQPLKASGWNLPASSIPLIRERLLPAAAPEPCCFRQRACCTGRSGCSSGGVCANTASAITCPGAP